MERRRFLSGLALGSMAWTAPGPGLAAAMPGLTGYIRTNWSRDPYSYGSYSHLPLGVAQSDRTILEAPISDRIFFAGEAVHPKRNATVHAAHESGIRTARMVLRSGQRNIAIIGAGMSGLSAAKMLADQGRRVTVIEARDRIGGRIWTDDRLGVALDLGASWIHGTCDNPLIPLARQADMIRIATNESYVLRDGAGNRLPGSRYPDWLAHDVAQQLSMGADPDTLNREAHDALPDYPGPEVVMPQGYAPILQTLAGPYQTRLSQVVQAVRMGRNGVSLDMKNASSLEADAVIVTVPLGVLKRGAISFDPLLPTNKQRAIDRLGMGTLDKLYLRFQEPFWERDRHWIMTIGHGMPRGRFNEWLNLVPFVDAPVIVGLNGGSNALALADRDDAELVQMGVDVLAGAYGY